MTDYIIYHDKCSDGKMSAAIMYIFLKEESAKPIKVLPYSYSVPAPDLCTDADNVYVVDFSFLDADLEKLSKNSNKVIIIDHHKGALEKMEATSKTLPNVEIHFELNKSGAHLVWEYCFPDIDVPDVVLDVSDRDLWRFLRPNSRATHLGLSGLTYLDIANSDLFTFQGYDNLVQNKGKPCLEFSERMDKVCAESPGTTLLLGKTIYTVNCHMQQASEVGNLILSAPNAKHSAVMVYMIGQGTSVKLSFRSTDGSARILANVFGGGGHDNAAGAKVTLDVLSSILKGNH